jgi:FKBP12-rapamycin complex-associated protein
MNLLQDCMSLMPRLKSPLVPKSQQGKGSPVAVSSSVGNHFLSLYESAACRQLMTERFDDVCKDVLTQRNLRSSHVHHTLLAILPRLAAFNKEKFVKA